MLLSSCDIGFGHPAYLPSLKKHHEQLQDFVFADDGETQLPVTIDYTYTIQDEEIYIEDYDWSFLSEGDEKLTTKGSAAEDVRCAIEGNHTETVNF